MFRQFRAVLMVAVLVMIGAGWKDCGGKQSAGNGNANTQPISSKEIDKLARTSQELSHDVGLGIDAVSVLFKTGKLSLEQKDFLADKLGKLSEAGGKFNAFVMRLDEQEKAGTLPANWLQLIRNEWSTVFDLWRAITSDISTLQLAPAEQKQLQAGTDELEKSLSTIQRVLGAR